MTPDISEFSYGYALTQELCTDPNLKVAAAPVFPSLIEEGRAGGGYDVSIPFSGAPLFLQFKLSHCMVRPSKVCPLPTPYYRMHLRPLKHSRQHSLLLELEDAGNLVAYAAPAFHEPAELNAAYLGREVAIRSLFISPRAIGELPDPDEHCIEFSPGVGVYLRSTPRSLGGWVDGREWLEQRVQSPSDSLMTVGRDLTAWQQLARVLERIGVRAAGEADGWLRQPEWAERSPVHRVAFLARAVFQCELLVVSRRETVISP